MALYISSFVERCTLHTIESCTFLPHYPYILWAWRGGHHLITIGHYFGGCIWGGQSGECKPQKCIPLNPNHRHPGLNFSVAGLSKRCTHTKACPMPTPRESCRGRWGQRGKRWWSSPIAVGMSHFLKFYRRTCPCACILRALPKVCRKV